MQRKDSGLDLIGSVWLLNDIGRAHRNGRRHSPIDIDEVAWTQPIKLSDAFYINTLHSNHVSVAVGSIARQGHQALVQPWIRAEFEGFHAKPKSRA